MSQNPLLGKRISLISKKNIRYEGLLYSINEQNLTVALQNVRSYGTEGREQQEQYTDPTTGALITSNFVPPNDAVHPYLLFRGQDIKDLHVHESQPDSVPVIAPAPSVSMTITSNAASPPSAATDPMPQIPEPVSTNPPISLVNTGAALTSTSEVTKSSPSSSQQQLPARVGGGRGAGRGSRPRKPHVSSEAAVGTGASLLSRKERLAASSTDATTIEDFDFEQAANKESVGPEESHDVVGSAYAKDDFFDSISCETLDKQAGIDNRLRGHQERRLNTETFGAVALNNNMRRRGGGRSGRGTGRSNRDSGNRGSGYEGGGRGRGRGRSSGRGGRGRGYGGRNDNRTDGIQRQAATTAGS